MTFTDAEKHFGDPQRAGQMRPLPIRAALHEARALGAQDALVVGFILVLATVAHPRLLVGQPPRQGIAIAIAVDEITALGALLQRAQSNAAFLGAHRTPAKGGRHPTPVSDGEPT